MADFSYIQALLEALRGGNNPQGAPAWSRRSYYNPYGQDPQNPDPSKLPSSAINRNPDDSINAGMRDPEYAAYVRKAGGMAKPYMKWIEEGD